MLDEKILKNLHDIQAKMIRETGQAVSFSQIINEVIRKAIM